MRLQIVHLRVKDAATNKPTPCRIRISDSSGNEYAPLGRPLNFSCNRGEDVGGHCRIAGERWFSIDGQCEIALPPGELRVQVRKGLEYSPIDQVINQPAGKMSIRLTIERRIVIGKPDSITMDFRCHHQSPHSAALDAAAEDLDYVHLLAEPLTLLGLDGNTYMSVPNLEAFSGQEACLDQHGSKVIVNTHNRHPLLGSLALVHSHRVVNPLSFGGPDNADDWSLRDWAGQCHRKGGLVVWTEPFAWNMPFAGEALALAILGEIDAFELSPNHLSTSLRGWYQLLDVGIRLPIVGASGRVSNDRTIGALQTITYSLKDDWVGMIEVSSRVTNGVSPVVTMDGNQVYASAASVSTFGGLDLLVNGQIVCHADGHVAANNPEIFVATLDCIVQSPGWVAARVLDSVKSPKDGQTLIFAHTFVKIIGDPPPKPQAVEFLMGHLDRARDWVETEGRFEQPKFRKQLLDTFDEAKAKLMSKKRS